MHVIAFVQFSISVPMIVQCMKSKPYIFLLHPSWNTQHEDLSSLFCSELVAAAYQFVGLLEKIKPSNRYMYNDFATAKNLTLQK